MNKKEVLNWAEELSAEELAKLLGDFIKVRAKKQFPVRYQTYLDLEKYFEAEGFTQVTGKDYRFKEKDGVGLFNCPHICGMVSLKDNNSDMSKKFVIPTLHNKDLTEGEKESYYNDIINFYEQEVKSK